MVEPESLVLEHLRALRTEMAKMANEVHTIRIEMTAMRQHMSGMMTIQEHDHAEIGTINSRLDRIEKRLDLVE